MAPLRFRADASALLAFFVLVLAFTEAHVCAHNLAARAICGAWGTRNFSSWEIREGCAIDHPVVVLARFAGPLFNYAVIWLGAWLMSRTKTQHARALGLALILAPLPLARIFTAATGHGDEVLGLTALMGSHKAGWAAGLVAALLLTLYPLARAYCSLVRRWRIFVFGSLLVIPILVHDAVVHVIMNHVLASGMLTQAGLFGAPALINLWQCLAFGGAAVTWQNAAHLFTSD